MSDYTSSPSRPASPVGPLPDLPIARPSAYRFNWDPTLRRPGPASVSETTEGRGDYFTTTPKVDIYGATSSTANLQLGVVPSQWSSAKHGFHAISTVVNNPHKKSAPPKAHATVPPIPRAELPRVRRKDFDPYLTAVVPEWEAFQHNLVLGCAASTQLERVDLDSPTDTLRTPRPPKLLPPLSTVPEVFFKPDFDLGDPRTFDAVAEVPPSSSSASSYLSSASSSTSPTTPHDPSTLAHSLPLLEKLSHHADTLEQHLVHEIARRATPFFAALSNLQDLQAESAHCLSRVQALRAQLTDVGENGARRGLRGVQREVRLAHLREVQAGVRAIRGVVETVGVIRGLVDGHEWGAALDGVDDLRGMWDGAPAMPPPVPSRRGTPLPSVAEEEPPGNLREEGHAAAVLDIPLSKLKAFAALPSQLQTLTQDITSSLTSDLVAVLKIGLAERIHRGPTSLGHHTDMADRLRPLIQGLVRAKNLRDSLSVWRVVVLEEVQGIVQQHVPSFDPAEDPQKESAEASWISLLRSMTHQEFQIVLRSILKSFLNCVEGLQALNGIITEVIESIRPPALPSELTAIHDSLFDTLSSSAEAANVLTSKVISTRADQHVKLDLREFVETFNECWSFVVRCEVICRRMIVGLRGVVVSQAKSFLQAFHQSRISQSAKLVEDEQWMQADVPISLQQVVNFILDAAVHDPREFVLKIETAVAAPSSPLVPSSLRPPSSPLLAPGKDSRPSSPRPSSPRASPRANGTPQVRKHLRIEERSYFTVPATQETLLLLTDYLKVIVNLSLLTTDTMSRVIEFLKAFNSRTCQVVLGAGAMRSAGLKNITAKHLALASQSLSIVIALVPYVRETFRRHLSPKQAVMLVEFDKLKRDYQEHQNEIHAKLVAIMGDRLSAHIKSLNAIRWDALPAKAGTNEYMELLVKETVTLHKVLSRYLASAVVEFVMTQVFAAINHRLSEEYTKIDLPTLEAKERLLTDARYLHEKFSVLKTAGAPTALLETLVADKRVTTAPVSPRPTTPTPASPLPLPSGNVPLGAGRAPLPAPTKRGSLFSNERIKGMLSRGPTAPPVPSPASPPPMQEKPGGFKQVAAPLSPPPLPAEGEPPTTALVNGVESSSSSHVSVSTSGIEDPQEPVDESVGPERGADVSEPAHVDAEPQEDRETAERPPPTPAKDGEATPASVPVTEGASEAT
ncbi:Vps54-like protein-domain-containing protein [Lactarius akahatsu]|uniref:Vps54-like protein-domain-containing protein n=1 Tax=Lactarius akahatsu TaxID=416441 RepID=A0AAD4Q9W1_9AGAM|nr:Vps54-like protein-domain-containing protein [Lactarius akahatsu]